MKNLVNVSEGSFLALHGLTYIAQHPSQLVSVKLLSKVLQASEAHLAKVFQKLSKADLVISKRGPDGGFKLKKAVEEITFLDIFEVIEGKVVLGGCPFDRNTCAFEKCIFNQELNRISRDIYNTFKNIKLNDDTII